ncbi:MAG: hypothetical protein HZB59_09805 [Ignavibacteriales bacterium]|nr:hypothetical protein [Ignavibacteriales bacterium]
MKKHYFKTVSAIIALVFSIAMILPGTANAHCDTMDGPVVKAAQKALDTKNVALVLVWVQPKDETAIKEAFDKTLKIRQLNPEAKELADMYFFETLVRIHRAGEGAPYTGLKPAGSEVEPGIEMADKAVEKGSSDELMKHLSQAIQKKVSASFNEVIESKNYKKDDVEAGRKFVKAYVEFIHYIEAIHKAVAGSAGAHGQESDGQSIHKEGH